MNNQITKKYEITFSDPYIMERFERLLALFHFNSSFGHSGMFGMSLDGDGPEKIKINSFSPKYCHEVDAIGDANYDIDIAIDNGYSGRYINKEKEPKYKVGPAAFLSKDGDIVKVIPSCDWDHPKNQ